MRPTTTDQTTNRRIRPTMMACMQQGLKECRVLIEDNDPLTAAHRRFLLSQAERPSNGIASEARALLTQLHAAHPASTAQTNRGETVEADQQRAAKRCATAQAFPLMARMAPAFQEATPPIDQDLRKHFETGFLNAVNELTGAASKSLDDMSGEQGRAHDAGWRAAHQIYNEMRGGENA